jgi:dihydrofolate reductase
MTEESNVRSDVGSEGAANGGGGRVVVQMFVTLDGYIVGPDEDISWVVDGFDPAMAEDIAVDMSDKVDVFVFGRVTHDIFAAYWPNAVPYDQGDDLAPAEGKEDPRIISALNERSKVVFSRTMEKSEWHNTRVVAEGIEAEIRRLKQETDGAISTQGSASVVQALARADLVDEYWLYLHPVVLGAGTPLFAGGAGGPSRRDFDLAQLKQYANGVVGLSYVRKDGQRS